MKTLDVIVISHYVEYAIKHLRQRYTFYYAQQYMQCPHIKWYVSCHN